MKTFVPDYYAQFRCLAGACRHSCCIGWEIDVDDASRERYRHIGGALGERLCESIAEENGTAHFRLDSRERCPFLNEDGLCDIILLQGEDALCQICRDHPRFRHYFSDRTEVGLGLCCEAAARLILTRKEKMMLCPDDGGAEEEAGAEEEELLGVRDALIAVAQDRSRSVESRMEEILTLCGAVLPELTAAQWAEVYLRLERLDDAWTRELRSLCDTPAPAADKGLELPLEQLLVYFLFRHLADACDGADFAARAALCVLSVRMIRALCGAGGIERLIEVARLYSSEVEYSEENMDALLAMLEKE